LELTNGFPAAPADYPVGSTPLPGFLASRARGNASRLPNGRSLTAPHRLWRKWKSQFKRLEQFFSKKFWQTGKASADWRLIAKVDFSADGA